MEYQKLLLHSRDKFKLDKIREKLKSSGGGIFEGIVPSSSWGRKNLGESYERVILASSGIESLDLNEITALGGWCAVRTNDMLSINEGRLCDLIEDSYTEYSDPLQVANWLIDAISIDQITESIGSYSGDRYTLISEQKLWSDRIKQSVEGHMGRELTKEESESIEKSVSDSEKKRKEITKRYLNKVSGKENKLTVVIDRDIFEELISERNLLLEKVSVTLKDLAMPIYLNRVKVSSDQHDVENIVEQNIIKDLVSYVDSYSIVWFMYTGPYLELLKKHGYVKTEKAVIIEPWSHASSNESESLFNQKVFEQFGINNYLDSKGFNANIGFVAMDEVSTYSWKKIRASEPISKVPNIKNYKLYMKKLEDSRLRGELDLSKNQIFLDAVNYYPFNECLVLIKQMIELREEWLNLKSSLVDKEVTLKKIDFKTKMKSLEDQVLVQLGSFFDYVLA